MPRKPLDMLDAPRRYLGASAAAQPKETEEIEIQVKLFKGSDSKILEAEINEFLARPDGIVTDIKTHYVGGCIFVLIVWNDVRRLK